MKEFQVSAQFVNLGIRNELTETERNVVQWMLELGKPEAKDFIPQLAKTLATDWRCSCGCASVNFAVEGFSEPSGELYVLADFVFDTGDNLSGIFVFQKSGVLAGLEVYGLAGEAPKSLPLPESLCPFPKIAE